MSMHQNRLLLKHFTIDDWYYNMNTDNTIIIDTYAKELLF